MFNFCKYKHDRGGRDAFGDRPVIKTRDERSVSCFKFSRKFVSFSKSQLLELQYRNFVIKRNYNGLLSDLNCALPIQ